MEPVFPASWLGAERGGGFLLEGEPGYYLLLMMFGSAEAELYLVAASSAAGLGQRKRPVSLRPTLERKEMNAFPSQRDVRWLESGPWATGEVDCIGLYFFFFVCLLLAVFLLDSLISQCLSLGARRTVARRYYYYLLFFLLLPFLTSL